MNYIKFGRCKKNVYEFHDLCVWENKGKFGFIDSILILIVNYVHEEYWIFTL